MIPEQTTPSIMMTLFSFEPHAGRYSAFTLDSDSRLRPRALLGVMFFKTVEI